MKSPKTKTTDSEVDTLKNQLARALADYDNLRKRSEAEKSVWSKFAKEQILVKLLPALDNLELVQKHLGDQGLAVAIAQFTDVFKEEGVERVDIDGDFDENIHEAIDIAEGGKKGKIAEVIQSGYKFADGTVIRPAKVRVYDGKSEARNTKSETNQNV